MTFGQMTFGQVTISQITVVKMTNGQRTIGQLTIDQIDDWSNDNQLKKEHCQTVKNDNVTHKEIVSSYNKTFKLT